MEEKLRDADNKYPDYGALRCTRVNHPEHQATPGGGGRSTG